MTNQSGINAVQIIEEFLISVVEQLPQDAEMVARSLQKFIPTLETLLYRLESQLESQKRTINRLRQQIDYLKSITVRSADLATKSTVIDGIISRLRSIMIGEQDEI